MKVCKVKSCSTSIILYFDTQDRNRLDRTVLLHLCLLGIIDRRIGLLDLGIGLDLRDCNSYIHPVDHLTEDRMSGRFIAADGRFVKRTYLCIQSDRAADFLIIRQLGRIYFHILRRILVGSLCLRNIFRIRCDDEELGRIGSGKGTVVRHT